MGGRSIVACIYVRIIYTLYPILFMFNYIQRR